MGIIPFFIARYIVLVPISLHIVLCICSGEKYNFKRYVFVLLFIGMPLIYFCGVMQLMFLTGLNILEAAAMGAAPFLIGDIIKIFAAAYLARKIKI